MGFLTYLELQAFSLGNEGLKYLEKLGLVFSKRERLAKKGYNVFENEDSWRRLGHKYATSLA